MVHFLFLAVILWLGVLSPGQDLKDGEVLVRMETPLGTIDVAIDAKHAPITAANFLKYVDGGFYNGGRFHRTTRSETYHPVLPNRPEYRAGNLPRCYPRWRWTLWDSVLASR